LYLANGAELVGEPEVDETAEVRWVPVDETPTMIARGPAIRRRVMPQDIADTQTHAMWVRVCPKPAPAG
jgi:hypothetical protein